MKNNNFDKMITKIGGSRSIVTEFDVGIGLWKTIFLAYDDTILDGPVFSPHKEDAIGNHGFFVEQNSSL